MKIPPAEIFANLIKFIFDKHAKCQIECEYQHGLAMSPVGIDSTLRQDGGFTGSCYSADLNSVTH
ncbi:hypothetical protein D3C84_997170 [compost metagenome]